MSQLSQSGATTLSAPLPNSWHMVRALGGVGILCSLLIVLTFQATLPVITRNKAEALEQAIFKVLPGATQKAAFEVMADGQLELFVGEPKGERLVFVGYDDSGELVGVALEATGQGFQEAIRLLYGYAPGGQTVVGMEVLESRETPGLGDKIMKDASFLANFVALDVALNAGGTGLANPIVAVKFGQKKNPWEVDGITGATISSEAVADIMRASAEEMLPIVRGQLEKLKRSDNG